MFSNSVKIFLFSIKYVQIQFICYLVVVRLSTKLIHSIDLINCSTCWCSNITKKYAKFLRFFRLAMGNAALKQHFVKILEQHAPLLVKERAAPVFGWISRIWSNVFISRCQETTKRNEVDRTFRFQNMKHIEMKKHNIPSSRWSDIFWSSSNIAGISTMKVWMHVFLYQSYTCPSIFHTFPLYI